MNFPKLTRTERAKLHSMLLEAITPWADSDIRPIVIGWYQQQSSHPIDRQKAITSGMFRLQYGARAWITHGTKTRSDIQEQLPQYESALMDAAELLGEQAWHRLANSILAGKITAPRHDEAPDIEICLRIDGTITTLSLRRKKSNESAHFRVTDTGFESISSELDVWGNSFNRIPTIPPISQKLASSRQGGQQLAGWNTQALMQLHAQLINNDTPKSKMQAQLITAIEWWFNTPLQQEEEARKSLGFLLLTLGDLLQSVGAPIAIAESPNCFNDVSTDTNWRAVYVGGICWENGSYFQNNATRLAAAPPAITMAIGIVEQMVTCGLRKLVANYLGNTATEPDTMVLSYDARGLLLAFSSSHEFGGPVYKIQEESGLPQLIGVTDRLDTKFNTSYLNQETANTRREGTQDILNFMPVNDWLAETIQYAGAWREDYPAL